MTSLQHSTVHHLAAVHAVVWCHGPYPQRAQGRLFLPIFMQQELQRPGHGKIGIEYLTRNSTAYSFSGNMSSFSLTFFQKHIHSIQSGWQHTCNAYLRNHVKGLGAKLKSGEQTICIFKFQLAYCRIQQQKLVWQNLINGYIKPILVLGSQICIDHSSRLRALTVNFSWQLISVTANIL